MGKVVAQTLEESGGASFMRMLESGLPSEELEWGPMLKDIVEGTGLNERAAILMENEGTGLNELAAILMEMRKIQ